MHEKLYKKDCCILVGKGRLLRYEKRTRSHRILTKMKKTSGFVAISLVKNILAYFVSDWRSVLYLHRTKAHLCTFHLSSLKAAFKVVAADKLPDCKNTKTRHFALSYRFVYAST